MFCDLVGSTPLSSQLDPEDLHEVIGAYQRSVGEVVKRFEGFVAKYMGDGILIYFGYPHAHEDDAERAVRCALSAVEAVPALKIGKKLQARVGIATGMVVVGGEAREHDVIGETPNLAARLQGLADPNTVLVDESTRRLVGHLFEYRDLGGQEVKGFSGVVSVWEVLRPSIVESRFEAFHAAALTPLIGREEEMELLLRRWARAKDGDGQIVLISGEAGIGKSRITAALQEQLGGQPYTRLRYFGSPHHCDSPLHPVIAQLERAAGFVREDTPATKLDKLDILLSKSGENSAQAAALIADLLAVPNDGRYPPLPYDPQRQREETFASLVRQLEGLALGQPVLVIFEDAHWADSTSLELIEIILEHVPRLPVLFVMTFRPEFQPPRIGEAHVTLLTLARLDQRETATLAERVAGDKPLPAEVLAQIVERADGIPLFTEELTKTLLEGGLLHEQGGRYIFDAPLPTLAIPSSLQASLLARLDRLAPVREVAQIGAALGREFSYEALAAVAGRAEAGLSQALDQLAEAGLVSRRGTPPRATFLFKHALIQDAAYSTLLRGPRQQLHARIGKVLEEQFHEVVATAPEILAHHYTQAGLYDLAIDYWRQAGERALRSSANIEGVTHFRKALELIRQLPATRDRDRRELDLHLALGRMMRASKGYASLETRQVFSRARELLNEEATVNDQLTVFYGLCIGHYVRAEHDEALKAAQQCLALAAPHQNIEAQAFADMMMGHSLWAVGEFSDARRHLERTLDFSATAAERGIDLRFSSNNAVAALSYLAWTLWPLGYTEQASVRANDALRLARGIGHVTLTAYALTAFAMYTEVVRGTSFAADQETADANQAVAYTADANQAVAYCVEHRVTAYEPWARFCQGLIVARQRGQQHGIELMRGAMKDAEKIDANIFRPLHLGHLAAAYAQLGRVEVGLGLLNKAIETVERTNERFFEAELHRLRGALLLEHGNTREGEIELRRGLAIARRQQARLWELRGATSLARLWRDQSKHAEARELLAPIYGWFTEGFDTPDLQEAKALLTALDD